MNHRHRDDGFHSIHLAAFPSTIACEPAHMHFLYPSHPLDPKQPDEPFQDQVNEIRRRGLGVSIVCLEELAQENCRIRGPIPEGATVVYRGWMLSQDDYKRLLTRISQTEQLHSFHWKCIWRVTIFRTGTHSFPNSLRRRKNVFVRH